MSEHERDGRALLRQWSLIKALAARRYGLTVKEMAQETQVTVRTIRRDLQLFLELGFPLHETVGDYGRKQWRLDPAWTEIQQHFTFDEALALLMARRLLDPLAGSPLGQAAQNAFQKIRASLTENVVRYLDRIASRFYVTQVGVSNYAEKSDCIDQILLGIEDSCAVFLTYQSLNATEPVTYDIYPYGIAYHRGSLYVVGYSCAHEALRHWKVDRILEAQVTLFPFHRPPDFDLQSHLAGSFGIFHGDGNVQVRVRFLPAVARYVAESTWHPSQRLTAEPDGSLVGEFALNSVEEIQSWVRGFGPLAEVLAPAELRESLRQEFLRAAELYGAPPASTPNAAATRRVRVSR